jgi:integrase
MVKISGKTIHLENGSGGVSLDKKQTQIPFIKLLDRYIEYANINYKAAFRVEVMKPVFVDHFREKTLDQINSWDMEKYKSNRKGKGIRPSTINRELTILRRMFNLAIQWGMADFNPVKGVKFYKVSNEKPNIFSNEQLQTLSNEACPNLRLVIMTAAYSGLRLGELLNLKWKDVDLDNGFIYVRDSKNFESRAVPLHPELKHVLTNVYHRDEAKGVFRYKNRNSLGSSYRKVMKRLGIKNLTFHSLRHTFATNLAMDGADLTTIQELLGQKSIIMTKRYSHPTPEHKKGAVSRLNFQRLNTSLDTSEASGRSALSPE